jgi:hypothetical protein
MSLNVFDADVEVLRQGAEGASHAAQQAATHIQAEFGDDVLDIMSTLVADEPYAYTLMGRFAVNEDGSFTLPIATTRQDIFDGYTEVHERLRTLTWSPMVEVYGEWYAFHEGMATIVDKATGVVSETGPSIGLFPCRTGQGITGELIWGYRAPGELGVGAKRNGASATEPSTERERLVLRQEVIRQHDRYLDAMRASDVEGIIKTLSSDAQGAIRDYVNDTGTLISLDGSEAHRSFYRSLFDKYQVRSVDVLRRVAQHWYVFTEARVTVTGKVGMLAFHTAEYFITGHDGRFLVRIGHGTDPAPVAV